MTDRRLTLEIGFGFRVLFDLGAAGRPVLRFWAQELLARVLDPGSPDPLAGLKDEEILSSILDLGPARQWLTKGAVADRLGLSGRTVCKLLRPVGRPARSKRRGWIVSASQLRSFLLSRWVHPTLAISQNPGLNLSQ